MSVPPPSLRVCRTQVAVVRALLDELEVVYQRPFHADLTLQLADEVAALAASLRQAAEALRATCPCPCDSDCAR